MKLQIDSNIRRLRRMRGLTQEELAEILNVTPQSVSRWETGEVFPDLMTLAGAANFFRVSLDELTGMDRIRSDERPGDVIRRAGTERASGRLDEAEAILRGGLKLYPNNLGIMSELALTLTRLGAADEAIGLSERVLSQSTSDKLRATTAANLVYLYLSVGRDESARRLASGLPHMRECRELIEAELARTPEEYSSALQKAAKQLLTLLCHKLERVGERICGEPDKTIADGVSDGEDVGALLTRLRELIK